jgi:hypothetical protein
MQSFVHFVLGSNGLLRTSFSDACNLLYSFMSRNYSVKPVKQQVEKLLCVFIFCDLEPIQNNNVSETNK